MKYLIISFFVLMFSTANANENTRHLSNESLSNLQEVLSLDEFEVRSDEDFKLAMCMEVICCKRSYSGREVCKVVCNMCPIGWVQE